MPKQLLEAGEVISHKGQEYEVVHVMVNTDKDDKPTAYIYEIITKQEADANRKQNEEAQRAEAKRVAEEDAKRAAEEQPAAKE